MFPNYRELACATYRVVTSNLETLSAKPLGSLTVYEIKQDSLVVGTVRIASAWREKGFPENLHAVCIVHREGADSVRVVMPEDHLTFYEKLGQEILSRLP